MPASRARLAPMHIDTLAMLLAVAPSIAVVLGASPAGAHDRGTAAGGPCEMRSADRRSTSSQRCLTCHDGTTGAGISFALGGGTGRGDHPVDVGYERSRARDRRLRPSAELPPSLPLVNGRIACTTCHAPESTEPGHTAMPMRLSAMCLACHDL